MVGLIGPDGVGKSSLLALIAGARVLQRGRSRCWAATWPSAATAAASCPHRLYAAGLGQEPLPHAVGEENLQFFAACFQATPRLSGASASTDLTRPPG